ncbi:hypothetical protein MC885_007109, partial [Smutsia gigantea]
LKTEKQKLPYSPVRSRALVTDEAGERAAEVPAAVPAAVPPAAPAHAPLPPPTRRSPRAPSHARAKGRGPPRRVDVREGCDAAGSAAVPRVVATL